MKANETSVIKAFGHVEISESIIVRDYENNFSIFQMVFYYKRGNIFFFRNKANKKVRLELSSDCTVNAIKHLKRGNLYLIKCTPNKTSIMSSNKLS